MAGKDLYEILGVSKNATPEEIKAAFRSLAKQFHPDIYRGDKKEAEEKFKEIGMAYGILSDPEKRRKYDSYGMDGLRGGGAGAGGGQYQGFEDVFNMSDIFGEMFGDFFGSETRRSTGGGRRTKRFDGDDIQHNVTLTFEEAAFGKKETIELMRMEPCETCKGEGIKSGTKRKTCTMCGGQGKVRQTQGFFSMVTTCPQCRGEGEMAEHLCDDCNGRRVKAKKRKMEINIPAGVTHGSYLKLSGEGNSGLMGGVSGDLFLGINIKSHELFEREGDDIIFDLPVTVSQAVLGDETEIPTLYGAKKIRIPEGIQSGEVVTLRGSGFPHLNGHGKGDMQVIIKVEIPRGINSKLKEAFKNVKLLDRDESYGEVKRTQAQIKKYLKKEEE
jgi:molecular chaperone DnaJ